LSICSGNLSFFLIVIGGIYLPLDRKEKLFLTRGNKKAGPPLCKSQYLALKKLSTSLSNSHWHFEHKDSHSHHIDAVSEMASKLCLAAPYVSSLKSYDIFLARS
jgi:hypothetical protein